MAPGDGGNEAARDKRTNAAATSPSGQARKGRGSSRTAPSPKPANGAVISTGPTLVGQYGESRPVESTFLSAGTATLPPCSTSHRRRCVGGDSAHLPRPAGGDRAPQSWVADVLRARQEDVRHFRRRPPRDGRLATGSPRRRVSRSSSSSRSPSASSARRTWAAAAGSASAWTSTRTGTEMAEICADAYRQVAPNASSRVLDGDPSECLPPSECRRSRNRGPALRWPPTLGWGSLGSDRASSRRTAGAGDRRWGRCRWTGPTARRSSALAPARRPPAASLGTGARCR